MGTSTGVLTSIFSRGELQCWMWQLNEVDLVGNKKGTDSARNTSNLFILRSVGLAFWGAENHVLKRVTSSSTTAII